MDKNEVMETAALLSEHDLMALAVNESNYAVYVTDANAEIRYVNRVFTEMLGYEPEEVYGRGAREILGSVHYSDSDYARLWTELKRGRSVQEEVRTYDRHGREVWLTLMLRAVLGPDGVFSHLVGFLEDTTEARQIQTLQREVLEAVANEMPLKDIMSFICERVEAIFPEVVSSILAVDADKRLRPLAGPSLPALYNEAIDGLPIGPSVGSCGTAAWRGEAVTVDDIESDPLWADYKALPLPLGLLACWSSPIKLRDGRVAGTFAFYFRERRGPGIWHEQVVKACIQLCMLAFERHEAKARIARLAYYDSLTGLPNRALLRDQLGTRFGNSGEAPRAAFVFLDIDRFKDVNDTLGHSMGDSFLVEIARRLQQQTRPGDLVSRHGGDEFVIVLADADAENAARLAERLLEAVSQPVVIDGISLPASASIGISLCPGDGTDGDTLLKNADTAMYHAKSEGRGTYRFFAAEMNHMAQDRLLLGAALRQAIAERRLELNYQPQIEARTGELCGVEALARWTHPVFGAIPPSRFIPLAEDCALIEAIGEFSLDEACRQMRAWLDAGVMVPRVSVNISPLHFRNRALLPLVTAVLERYRLLPSMLIIEITEGVIMDASSTGAENAYALDKLGVKLSMDDFGTGYSSLSHLARLPVAELKIDRSFMNGLAANANAQALVTAVIRIGESLGLRVVAEGVETPAQRRFVEGLGCDVLQGYLFSQALPAEDLAAWIAARAPLPEIRGAA